MDFDLYSFTHAPLPSLFKTPGSPRAGNILLYHFFFLVFLYDDGLLQLSRGGVGGSSLSVGLAA